MKHISLRYSFVQEHLSSGNFQLLKVSGVKNPADMLTKVLDGTKHHTSLDTLPVKYQDEVMAVFIGDDEQYKQQEEDNVKYQDGEQENQNNGIFNMMIGVYHILMLILWGVINQVIRLRLGLRKFKSSATQTDELGRNSTNSINSEVFVSATGTRFHVTEFCRGLVTARNLRRLTPCQICCSEIRS